MSEFANMPLTETNLRNLIRDEVKKGPESEAPALWSPVGGLYSVENYKSGAVDLTARHITCESLEVKNQPRMILLDPGESYMLPLQTGAIQIVCRDLPRPEPPAAPWLEVDGTAMGMILLGFFVTRLVRWVHQTYQRGCEIAKMEEELSERHK